MRFFCLSTIMSWLDFLIFVLSFVGMEIFSWAVHKYIMHGVLWTIHKSHHNKRKGFFELNDVFSLSFGTIATVLMMMGLPTLDARFWIGMGITFYGIVYFILHDFFIHKRLTSNRPPWNNRYLRGITLAHQAHHQTNEQHKAVSFGLLWVSWKYFKSKN